MLAPKRLTPDFSELEPASCVGLPAEIDAGARFDTTIGNCEISFFAPDILRLRLGKKDLPDYGILAARPQPVATALRRDGDEHVLEFGNLELRVLRNPLRFCLYRRGKPLMQSATEREIAGPWRLPSFARTPDGYFAAIELPTGEPVYGLGEKWGTLNRRGQFVISENLDSHGVNMERSYKNCPFAWSPRGWGLFVHTPGRVSHAVGFPNWSHRAYIVEAEDECLDLFLIVAGSPAEMLDRFTSLTGRAEPPPLWTLGAWFSRNYYRTQAEALDVARTLRDRRIPCDVLNMDDHAWLEPQTRFAFEWDRARVTDPAGLARDLHALDLRLSCWEFPYVSVETDLFAEMDAKGWFLKDGSGETYRYSWPEIAQKSSLQPPPAVGVVDFTNPDAYAYWRDRHGELIGMGVDVMKLDFGEQVPHETVAHNGDSGRRMHNAYALLYARCVGEAFERRKGYGFTWCRSGWAGSQRGYTHWGGDAQSDWEGLAANLRGGLSWGLTGVPGYATDIGGYYGGPPSPELYVRWAQAGMFFSHLRFHGMSPREPWFFGEEAEAIVRRFLELRYRLLPYLQALLDEAARTGLPPHRAMPLAFPDQPETWHYDTQFMFGPSLFVAAIVRPGGNCHPFLPRGVWYDFWSGEAVEGGRVLDLTVPLDRFPLFVRQGDILPFGPIVQHTGELSPENRLEEIWAFGLPERPPPGTAARLVPKGGGVLLTGLPPNLKVRAFGGIDASATPEGHLFTPKRAG